MCIIKMFSTVIISVLFASLVTSSENNEEYFWRPWTAGSPPSDAVTGRDYRGVSYIIEGYAPNFGEFVGQAFTNQHDVNVSALHINNPTQLVQNSHSLKVLCSQNKDKLAWYPTNYKTLGNDIITGTIHPVLGGYNTNGDVLYVGRYVDINLRIVFFGSVCSASHVHYHYGGLSYSQLYFEILIVDNTCNK